MTYVHRGIPWARLAWGAGAFGLADLILGMAAFSTISLGSLWMFCVGWIVLVQEYASRGVPFGTPGQLGLAWIGAVVAIPALFGTVRLAREAFRLPGRMFRTSLDAGAPPRDLAVVRRGRRS